MPNNNDYVRSKYVLNEGPNRNDATCVTNNVHLTTMCAIQFSMAAVYLQGVDTPIYPVLRSSSLVKVFTC